MNFLIEMTFTWELIGWTFYPSQSNFMEHRESSFDVIRIDKNVAIKSKYINKLFFVLFIKLNQILSF